MATAQEGLTVLTSFSLRSPLDFTGIPTWATKVYQGLQAVSTAQAGHILVNVFMAEYLFSCCILCVGITVPSLWLWSACSVRGGVWGTVLLTGTSAAARCHPVIQRCSSAHRALGVPSVIHPRLMAWFSLLNILTVTKKYCLQGLHSHSLGSLQA